MLLLEASKQRTLDKDVQSIQIVELAKESLPIDLGIEAVPSLIPE